MAKLPDETALGGAPIGASGRPIATYDTSGYARGAAAEAAGAAAIGQGAENLGKGIVNAGHDVGVAAARNNEQDSRLELARAKSDFLTQKIQLDATLPDETDHETLPGRYSAALGEIQQKSAALIKNPRTRELFDLSIADDIARGNAHADATANKLWKDATLADGNTRLEQLQRTAMETGNPADAKKIIETGHDLIDSLAAKNIITRDGAVTLRRKWAEDYAKGKVEILVNTDPEQAINALRAAPGSLESITSRIVQVEGGGRNPRSSASGTGQFIDETWLDVLKRNRPDLADGRSDDELLAMRADKNLGKEMTAALARENTAFLQKQGLEATPGNIYLAHFLGAKGASAVLRADPDQPVQDALAAAVGKKRAAAMVEANPSVLGGKLAGSVKEWSDAKMGGQTAGTGSVYDLLSPDTREKLLARAVEVQHRRNVDDLTAFKGRVSDTTTEAMNIGTVSKPMSQGEFVAALGAENGLREFKTYQAQLQLGADISKVAGLDPDQQQKLLESYTPQPGSPGYAEQAKRQQVLEQAITRERKIRASDPEFKRLIESSVAEAGRNGKASNPIEKAEFVRRFGTEDGEQAYASYSASLRLGRDVQNVGELSRQEQDQLLQAYEPTAGAADFVEASKRYDALQKAIGHIDMEKGKDPAAFAIRRLPVVQEAYLQFNNAIADPTVPLEVKQAAAQDFATKMDMEQARIGVPVEMRRLVPQEYVDQFNTKLSKPAAGGGTANVAAMIENEAKVWGEAWPQVYKQVSKGAAPVVMVIGSGVKPAAAQILTEFANVKLGDIANDQSEEKLGTIRKDVRDALRPLTASMAGNEGSQPVIDGFQAAGEKLAAYYVRGGKTSADAAKQAFDELLGHKYEFVSSSPGWFSDGWSSPAYRVPKTAGVTAAEVAAGVNIAKLDMAKLDIEPAKDTIGGLSPEYLKRETARTYARDGQWVTAPDESGLALIYKDRAVRRTDGKPLVLNWAQLARMGKDVPALGSFDPFGEKSEAEASAKRWQFLP